MVRHHISVPVLLSVLDRSQDSLLQTPRTQGTACCCSCECFFSSINITCRLYRPCSCSLHSQWPYMRYYSIRFFPLLLSNLLSKLTCTHTHTIRSPGKSSSNGSLQYLAESDGRREDLYGQRYRPVLPQGRSQLGRHYVEGIEQPAL